MSAKAELRELVDALCEEDAADALACVRAAVGRDGGQDTLPAVEEATRWERPTGPTMIPGREFMNQRPQTWQELAAEQGVEPVERFEDLLGDFWPEDEGPDEFVEALREWRREGGLA